MTKSISKKMISCMVAAIFAIAGAVLVLLPNEVIAAYQRTADNTVPAYTNSELTQRNGNERVDKGDVVTVFQETDRAYYVRYPTSRGTKDRWVPKNIFNSNPTPNTVTIADGWYRIQPMHDLSRSADALGPQIGNGNNVHMWTSVDALQQKFYLQNRGNGYFSLQSAYGSRLFVTADGNGNGANLYTSSWNGSDSQLFRLVNAGDNSYHIFSKVGSNLNFDCAGAGKADGNNVQLWTSENNPWHKWRFTPVSVGEPTPTPSIEDRVIERINTYINGSQGNYWKVNTKWTGGNECRGFAQQLYSKLFQGAGSITGYANNNYSASSYPGSYEAGRLFNFAANDINSVKSLFSKAKPGAFIQMGRRHSLNKSKTAPGPHTAILHKVESDGVWFYEANAGGTGMITYKKYTWADLADRNKGFTIYLPNNYSLR